MRDWSVLRVPCSVVAAVQKPSSTPRPLGLATMRPISRHCLFSLSDLWIHASPSYQLHPCTSLVSAPVSVLNAHAVVEQEPANASMQN